MRMSISAAVLAAICCAAAQPAGAIVVVPVGVQQNVPVALVTGAWGWSVAYQGTYGTFDVPISTLFAGVLPGDYVMYAARPTGSANFTLLAATIESDARAYTKLNTTTTSNGAQWYYNGFSIGFAGLGDTIIQSSADVSGVNSALRLSWHSGIGNPGFSQNVNVSPLDIDGGYRAGATAGLNNSSAWERFVLVGHRDTPVAAPEPASVVVWSLLGLSLAGTHLWRRRRTRRWAW